MQETDTKITVSSINDINSFNLERIITVKGTIENMSKAEAQISSKLRQSYENDLQAMAPQTMMFPGLHPMAMMATAGTYFIFFIHLLFWRLYTKENDQNCLSMYINFESRFIQYQ